MHTSKDSHAAIFAVARDEVLGATFRSEIEWQEIASPDRIAPFSLALAAGVKHGTEHSSALDSPSGTGRFILLYDPDSAEEWGGDFRVVCYAQAPLEVEIGLDPFIADVAWAWLTDALERRGATYDHISGTATKIISQGYGSLAEQGHGAQLELRASWTPQPGDFAAHAEAWTWLLCSLAGYPLQEGAVSLDAHRKNPPRHTL